MHERFTGEGYLEPTSALGCLEDAGTRLLGAQSYFVMESNPDGGAFWATARSLNVTNPNPRDTPAGGKETITRQVQQTGMRRQCVRWVSMLEKLHMGIWGLSYFKYECHGCSIIGCGSLASRQVDSESKQVWNQSPSARVKSTIYVG